MLSKIIKSAGYDLSLTMLEIGARPLDDGGECFHQILNDFPDSKVIAFEVDPELCKTLNMKAPEGMHFYPLAIGKTEEERIFYETNAPMCSSLYKPNEPLIDLFQNLHVAKLKQTSIVKTTSLDHVIASNRIGQVDFIKTDVQGAELDVFQGAEYILNDIVMIVSEVEFAPIYENQPLFADISSFLRKKGFAFLKFLGLSGRSMKPLVIKNDLNFPMQHLWADAVYIRDYLKLERMDNDQLLKAALLSAIYDSIDMAYLLLNHFDNRNQTQMAKEYLEYTCNA